VFAVLLLVLSLVLGAGAGGAGRRAGAGRGLSVLFALEAGFLSLLLSLTDESDLSAGLSAGVFFRAGGAAGRRGGRAGRRRGRAGGGFSVLVLVVLVLLVAVLLFLRAGRAGGGGGAGRAGAGGGAGAGGRAAGGGGRAGRAGVFFAGAGGAGDVLEDLGTVAGLPFLQLVLGLALSVDTLFVDGPGLGSVGLLGVHVQVGGLGTLEILDPSRSVLGNLDLISLTLLVHHDHEGFSQLGEDLRWDLMLFSLAFTIDSADLVVLGLDDQSFVAFAKDFKGVFQVESGLMVLDSFNSGQRRSTNFEGVQSSWLPSEFSDALGCRSCSHEKAHCKNASCLHVE
jgi:hypothetical protein